MEQKLSTIKNLRNLTDLCQRDIHRSKYTHHRRTDGHTFTQEKKLKVDLCKLLVEAIEFEWHLLSDNHITHSRTWTRRIKSKKVSKL